VKTLHIASILALSTTLAFACGDDDSAPDGSAGSSGKAAAGETQGGEGGTSSAGTSNGGKSSGGSAGTGTGGGGEQSGGAGGAPVGGEGGGPDANAGAGGEAPECHLLGEGGQGGAGGDGPGLGLGLEIIGTWEESFGGVLEITSVGWNDSIIREYDNDENVVYAQNSCAAYFPAKFSKYVYTQPTNDSFYYCTVVYDAATLEAAKASDATADEGNLDTGCSGFPWSKVTKQ
jgi:hypothetical protein